MTKAEKINVKVVVKDGQTQTTEEYEVGLMRLLMLSTVTLGSKDTELEVILTFHKGVPADIQKLLDDMRL